MAPQARADLVTELIVHAAPGAILAPGAAGLRGRLPMRPIVRHAPPGAAATQDVLAAMEHLA